MRISKFEDLEVWKRSKDLCTAIYRELKDLRDFTFRDQITRSCLSIPSNIAEGFERGSQKESVVFMSYAKGSCGELRTQIIIGTEIGYIKKEVGEQWLSEAYKISAMLAGLIKARRNYQKPP